METSVIGISYGEAARRLGVSTKTVSRVVGRGEIQIFKVGRAARVSVGSLHEYLRRQGVAIQ